MMRRSFRKVYVKYQEATRLAEMVMGVVGEHEKYLSVVFECTAKKKAVEMRSTDSRGRLSLHCGLTGNQFG